MHKHGVREDKPHEDYSSRQAPLSCPRNVATIAAKGALAVIVATVPKWATMTQLSEP